MYQHKDQSSVVQNKLNWWSMHL